MIRNLPTKLSNSQREFFIYCVIGVGGVAIDLVVFYILYNLGGLNEGIANVISTSLGITNNFYLNYRFNFKGRGMFWYRFGAFYLVGLLGIFITSILLLGGAALQISPNFTKAVAVVIVTIIQFLLNKNVSFRKWSKATSAE